VTKHDKDSFHNYAKFTEPVIRALHNLGVNAELTGRNDIVVDGKKISGNAQFATRGRMFSHGTLMFDVNLDNVEKALKVSKEKIESKGVKSVRSRVGNIRDALQTDMTIEEFKQRLLASIFEGEPAIPEYRLTSHDWEQIHRIAEERYMQWDWNYGMSPPFNVQRQRRFPAGTVDIRLLVENGVIKHAKIYGDFFGVGDVSEFAAKLEGIRYDRDCIEQALANVDVHHYFGNISREALMTLLY
jgi:lipoate-protein ligase A